MKMFLLEGYIHLKCSFSGHVDAPAAVPFAACEPLSAICNASIAGMGPDSIDCRMGMADAFDEDFTLRKAGGNSTDVPDLPICLTDLGLGERQQRRLFWFTASEMCPEPGLANHPFVAHMNTLQQQKVPLSSQGMERSIWWREC